MTVIGCATTHTISRKWTMLHQLCIRILTTKNLLLLQLCCSLLLLVQSAPPPDGGSSCTYVVWSFDYHCQKWLNMKPDYLWAPPISNCKWNNVEMLLDIRSIMQWTEQIYGKAYSEFMLETRVWNRLLISSAHQIVFAVLSSALLDFAILLH